MKISFIAIFSLAQLLLWGQPTLHIFEPFALYSDHTHESTLVSTPNIMDGAMALPYVLQIKDVNYEVRTNYIENKTTLEDVVNELKIQFQFNPLAEIIEEEYFNSFFILSFSNGAFVLDGERQESISTLAIKIIDEDFIFGINTETKRKTYQGHEAIKSIIENLNFVSLREMDQILGLPLTTEYYNGLKEKAKSANENTQIIDARYASQFSYEAYFDAWRKLPNYTFSLQDFGQAFFENTGKSPLAIIKRLHHFPLDYSTIESYLPNVRQAFIDTLQLRLFNNGDIIQDIQLSNSSSTSFQIYSSNGQDVVSKLTLATMKNVDGKWNVFTVNIPSHLSSEYDLQGTFEFVDVSAEITVIHSPLELKYYIQKAATSDNKWIEISQLPANSSEYVIVFPQSKIDTHFIFSSSASYVCVRNPNNETYWNKAYDCLKTANKIDIVDPLNGEEKSEYFLPHQPVFLHKKEAATRKDFTEIVKQNLSPDARLYSSIPLLTDLDGDGKKEFTIAFVSDGEVIGGSAYEFSSQEITKLNDQLFKKEIDKTVSIHNLKVYSQFIQE